MLGAVVIVCHGCSWSSVYVMAALYLMTFQQVTRFPSSTVLVSRVIVQAASPESG
jgi:hypothetical protein